MPRFQVTYPHLASDLVLVGILALEDPLRPGVREALADCARAGVQVKMCTGDHGLTAQSIARQCGILTDDGMVMEGPSFRALSDAERRQVVPHLRVLARSSPEDKLALVNTLKELGETVAVTGHRTNDAPALKAAHIGFSMGLTGTEVAKEASDIVLMDDNFVSIVKAIMWGRAVNDAVRRLIQFQATSTFSAVVVTLVSALAGSSFEDSVLGAVQLLWVAIIINTFAALALAMDPATPAVLARKPERRDAPLFTVDMIKQILGQSAYQVAIILASHFCGDRILGFPAHDLRTDTLVFNTFVFAQIFNSFSCRRLDRQLNIFEGIHKNPHFIGITLIGKSRAHWHHRPRAHLNPPSRGRRPDPHRLRRRRSLRSDTPRRTRVGHLARSRLRLHPARRAHPRRPQRALRARVQDPAPVSRARAPPHRTARIRLRAQQAG